MKIRSIGDKAGWKKIGIALLLIICMLVLITVCVLSYYYFYSAPVECRCKLGVNKRIVNGQIASKNFVPYQVSLATSGDNSAHFCSGVIVNSHWILTAAHCIANLDAYQVAIRVGLHELNETDIADRTYQAFKTFVHPSFKSDADFLDVFDVGIIRTFFPIKFIPKQVEPACLNLSEKKIYDDLLVSGWGTTSRTFVDGEGNVIKGNLSHVLKYAYYFEDPRLECREQIICTSPRIRKDSNCHGDSGGPLSFTRNSGNTTVEGVASFTTNAKDKRGLIYLCVGPTGYARLSSNKEFIESFVGDNYCGNLN